LLTDVPDLDVNDLVRTAIDNEAVSMLHLLFDHGADPNRVYKEYGRPLHSAIYGWCWAVVPVLVRRGADPFAKAKLYLPFGPMGQETLSPIEFAGYMKCLEKFNEVLGTEYKDTRPGASKLFSALRLGQV
jgi:hypothetical protein